MVDRTKGPPSKPKTGSATLTRILQDSIGNHLRSVYEIDRHIPERISRLLRLFEEQVHPSRGRSINPALGSPKVDGTSDDGLAEQRAHDRSSDTEDEAKR
jgi:hypothetical protein